MEHFQLRYFITVVDCQNFTRAAQKLNIAQPALSQQIQKLETELGTPLLIRGRKQSFPTTAGKMLYDQSLSILQLVDQTKQSLLDLVNLKSGGLRIATIPTVSFKLLPNWISQFQQSYPEIEYVLKEGTSQDVENWVLQGECELGYSQLPVVSPQLVSQDILVERFCVLLPQKHSLAKMDQIVFSRLRGEQLILYQGGKLAEMVLNRCHSLGWNPRIVCETSEFETLRALVQIGLGVAIVPEMAVEKDTSKSSLMAVPIKDAIMQRHIALVTPNIAKLSPLAEKFIKKTLPQIKL